jgi:phage tail sheath gpL-like
LTANYYAGERSPPGLTVSFPMPNLVVGRLSGGAGNPDIMPLIAALGDEWWTDIIIPWTDAANLNAIETEASRRFGPMVMQDVHIWTAAEGGLSAMSTLGSSRNSPHLTIFAQHWSLSPCWIWAASCAAVAIYNLAIDPARPLQTLAVPGLLPPLAGMRADFSTRNLLLRDGISTYRVDDGGRVVIERVITTYQTNAFGADDTSFLDIETLKSLAYLRYDLRNYLSVTFPRHKLADDDSALATAPNTVTPKTMQAHLIARYMLWRDLGLVEAPDTFKNDVRVERDETDPNRLNCLLPPDLINQLRITAAQIQYLL